ncbi:uncharacterized protein [Aegilops tauschii subsp. strangulata]|uniref:uncharacterized protein isoform X2 n=1 Tax=Aegilops tauschii subsp. strangulata TaxID=200361 RepID=UPI003CC88B44
MTWSDSLWRGWGWSSFQQKSTTMSRWSTSREWFPRCLANALCKKMGSLQSTRQLKAVLQSKFSQVPSSTPASSSDLLHHSGTSHGDGDGGRHAVGLAGGGGNARRPLVLRRTSSACDSHGWWRTRSAVGADVQDQHDRCRREIHCQGEEAQEAFLDLGDFTSGLNYLVRGHGLRHEGDKHGVKIIHEVHDGLNSGSVKQI